VRAWQYFWAISLLISAVSFAGITLVVAIRGLQDLRQMFGNLLEQKEKGE